MKRRIFLALLAVILAVGFTYLVRIQKARLTDGEGSVGSLSTPIRERARKRMTPSPTATPVRPQASPEAEEHAGWSSFQARFGQELVPEYSRGVLTGILGKRGANAKVPGFNPENARAAIARAREILEALTSELNIPPEFPLREPVFQGTPQSAQVHFRQMHEGIPLSPYGGLTIRLGPEGELERLDSSAIPSLHVRNGATLSTSDARAKALEAFYSTGSGWSSPPAVEGGGRLIWVAQPFSDAGPVEGRHAFDFTIGGDQIVIDGETGAVLYRRSRRSH